MKTAAQYHQAGQLDQAVLLYEQILQSDPNNAAALHLLGVIAYQRDRRNDALELIEKAIEINPKVPRFYNTLGLIFEALDKFDRASRPMSRRLNWTLISQKPSTTWQSRCRVVAYMKPRLKNAKKPLQSNLITLRPITRSAIASIHRANTTGQLKITKRPYS